MTEKAIVIYSGGMDSRTVLQKACDLGYECHALSVDYGQRHKIELEKAQRVCSQLGISHTVLDMTALSPILRGSALTSDIEMPHGHYEDENMKLTVVPNRNMILLSLAVAHAVSIGARTVFYGAHSGDHAIYPDCRPEFLGKMNDVARIANYAPIQILAPFIDGDKETILRYGIEHGVDYADTWTCYDPQDGKACGQCGSCQERLEAFAAITQPDPLEYV